VGGERVIFPPGTYWQAETFCDTDRVAAVREALSGPFFANYTPEQRADALQTAISFDIHCKPDTVITPVSGGARIGIELRTRTHLTTLNTGQGGEA
jgi:hypothetical protein